MKVSEESKMLSGFLAGVTERMMSSFFDVRLKEIEAQECSFGSTKFEMYMRHLC